MKSVFLIAEIDDDGDSDDDKDNDNDDDESLEFPISKADSKADVSQTHMKPNEQMRSFIEFFVVHEVFHCRFVLFFFWRYCVFLLNLLHFGFW